MSVKKYQIIFLLFFMIPFLFLVKGQDVQFSQFYANKLYLNPAFAGSNVCPSLALSYRNQWPNLKASYVNYNVAYDIHLKPIHGGLGIMAHHSNAGSGVLKTNDISFVYAYDRSLTRKLALKAGFQASYFQNTISTNSLRFEDMIDMQYGFVNPTAEQVGSSGKSGLDLSSGILLFSDQIYGGLSAHHLNEPRIGIMVNDPSRVNIKYTLHGGANIPVKSVFGHLFDLSPNILIQKQGSFLQINVGSYITKGIFSFSMWYRHGDAVISTLGINMEQYTIGYSYDFTFNQLSPRRSGGAHEISFNYLLNCMEKKEKIREIKCPKF